MKDSFYFQDKKLVDYDENNINEINIMGAYQLSVMNEDSLGWYISSDSTIKLDKVDMNRLFSAINGIQAVELVKSKNQDSFGNGKYSEDETITIRPIRTFPVIKDLVTDVSWNYEQNKTIAHY